MKTMNRHSRTGLALGIGATILAMVALTTVLRPGDGGKEAILAGCIWAYFFFLIWPSLRERRSRRRSSGSATSR